MSRIACLIALFTVGTSPVHAQLPRHWNVETAVTYGPRWNRAQRDPLNATPAALRLAYVNGTAPWGAELGVDFGGLRQSAEGRLKELIVGIGASRRVTPLPASGSASGVYVVGGLTQTILAPTSHARFAKLYGFSLGLTQRIALGKSGVVRADVAYARDYGRYFEGRYYPGVEGVAVRIGLGLRDDS